MKTTLCYEPVVASMSSRQGINRLMEAEQEAAKIISDARADKKAKLVRAQVEADAEIKKYIAAKDEEYIGLKGAKGVEDDSNSELMLECDKELAALKAGFDANKDKCVTLLSEIVSVGKF